MSNIITMPDQSVFDIAIQEYGSIEGVFNLLRANPELEFDSNIQPGTVLKIEGEPVKQTIVDFYRNNKIQLATGNLNILLID